MMNVLLISFSFPPAGGVGVLRALSLAKYLPENGCRVHVLTALNAPAVGRDESLLAQVPDAVEIHRTWTPDLPFTWRKRVKRLLTREKQGALPTKVSTRTSRATVRHALRTWVANLLLPDPQVGWIPFAFRAAKRIIREQRIQIVIITVPPFSTLKLTAKLRSLFPDLPVIVDFRDEWLTSTLGLVSFNKNERAKKVAQATEASAIASASAVVAVTEAAAQELRNRYPNQPSHKFHCVPNGFDGPAPSQSRFKPRGDRPIVLTYMGTIYGSTDPATLVQAVCALAPQVRDKIRIRFIGHIETASHRHALLSLGETVELAGFIPQAEALQALATSDYLLLLSHDPINVSAKFYDYLGAGKPILAALRPDGELRRLLDRTGAGHWADINDRTQIAHLLETAIQSTSMGVSQSWAPKQEEILAFHRRPLTARYARLLREVAETNA